MQFDSLADFIAMGNHGFYVWLAYGTTATVLVCYLLNLRMQRRRILSQIKWQSNEVGSSELGGGQRSRTGSPSE